MTTRVLSALALCLMAASTCGWSVDTRMLLTTPYVCSYGTVGQYKHCGKDKSGTFGACKKPFICASGNPWWSMCVTTAECPKQKGYDCNKDACGQPVTPPPPTTPCTGSVTQYGHCGKDKTGTYGSCNAGLICAKQNDYWSMCLTPAECPSQGGYDCKRDGCGNKA